MQVRGIIKLKITRRDIMGVDLQAIPANWHVISAINGLCKSRH